MHPQSEKLSDVHNLCGNISDILSLETDHLLLMFLGKRKFDSFVYEIYLIILLADQIKTTLSSVLPRRILQILRLLIFYLVHTQIRNKTQPLFLFSLPRH